MRLLYSLLFYLFLPLILLRVLVRSRLLPAYRQRLSERFGFYSCRLKKSIWVHAVSVGESLAAIPLIKAIKKKFPEHPILVTTMTPTGAERIRQALGDQVVHVYIPYDFPGAVKRFLMRFQPVIAIIMERELWPNLFAYTHQAGIPICLANARLSQKSADRYQRIAGMTKEMLAQITLIAAQTSADKARFLALGALNKQVVVTGNMKFDLEVPEDLVAKSQQLRTKLGKERFVWIAASTHEGEESIVIAAHQLVRKTVKDALLILVPRHPDRFEAIATLCESQFPTVRRSKAADCTANTAIFLGDTMGELLLMYGAADVAFVGGSLVSRGGHNVVEPGALGKAILTGESSFNFAEISELFLKANALQKISDAETLAQALLNLEQDSKARFKMGEAAQQLVSANRGALHKQLQCIYQLYSG